MQYGYGYSYCQHPPPNGKVCCIYTDLGPVGRKKKDSTPPSIGRDVTVATVWAQWAERKRTAFPPPNGGNVLHLHGYMPPVANRKTDSIFPFCEGIDAVR